MDIRGIEVKQFTGDRVLPVWESVQDKVAKAVEYAKGELTVDDVLTYLQLGLMQLFTFTGEVDITMVTELVQYPQYKVVRVVALSGKNLASMAKVHDYMDEWAVANGAIYFEAGVRDSMARHCRQLGYEPVYTIIRRKVKGAFQ
jgi:hypothetical protein